MDFTWQAISAAIRVEVRVEADGSTPYVLVFDNGTEKGKSAKRTVDHFDGLLTGVIIGWAGADTDLAWRFRTELLPPNAPPRGVVARRAGETDLPPQTPPSRLGRKITSGGAYGLIEHDGYTFDSPAAVLFYDALKESDLIFVVEPVVQHQRERPRPDFMVLLGGRAIRVEIDGYEFHAKTREQQSRDAARDRWYRRRGIETIRFTGRQVNADAAGCVQELIDVLRGQEGYPR